MRTIALFAVLLLVGCFVNAAESIPHRPLFRGKGFIKCFRNCKLNSQDLKVCGVKCLKKVNDKELKIRREIENAEKVVKVMADHNLPRHIAQEVVRKNITPLPPKIIEPARSKSDDVFVDGDHLAVKPEKLWAQYRSELFGFFRQGDAKSMPNLQMLAHPYSIDDESLPLFLNFIPTWSTSYERTNDKLTQNYDDFMMNVKVNDPTWSPEMDRLAQLLDAATQKMENAIYACLANYQNVPESSIKPTFEYYKKTRCYSVEQYTAEQRKTFFNYEQERKKVQGAGSRIYDAKTNYFTSASTGAFNWVTFGKISTFRDAAKENRVNGFQITLHHASSTSTETKLTSSFGFDVSATIYGVKLGVGYQQEKSKMNLKTSQQEFHVKLGAVGYIVMPVLPGNWFDGRILNDYKNGPFVSQPSRPYWGPSGSLRLLPKTVFLVVGPKVEMWVSKDDKEQMESMKSSNISGSISYAEVFGLKFDFKKGATMKSETTDNKLYKIEIMGNAYDPQIMAIDYESPNY